ncbi:hypothetical protein AB0912_07115 [Streptomyces sp. NPDC007084]|uniref:hypothetical protein n=1 Tax=Streptomyces sp. NPDC007084 TaxID=3154313 RepID=UPI0034554357
MTNPQPGRETPEAAYIGHVGDCRTCRRESGRCPRAERLWRLYQEWRGGHGTRPGGAE